MNNKPLQHEFRNEIIESILITTKKLKKLNVINQQGNEFLKINLMREKRFHVNNKINQD